MIYRSVMSLRKLLAEFRRKRKPSWRIASKLAPALPEIVCVDVGASYYPHTKWSLLLSASSTKWLVIDPNEENIKYTETWNWPSQVNRCGSGLSGDGGNKTLYVTNVDSGSSLLPPKILPAMKHRITNLEYFFPVTQREIETITLSDAVSGYSERAPILVKLDTQGTELSILKGADSLFQNRRIVGIELESTLLATPIMEGSGKFWQACEFLEAQGFELLHVKSIEAIGRSGRINPNSHTYVNECDAVFSLRRDVVASLSVEYRIALLAFYVTNRLYEEGLSLLEEDRGVCEFLEGRNVEPQEIRKLLEATL
jgi:FkbM family methyltransferase